MKAKPGDRVGAILSANEKTFELLGYGVYQGALPLPADAYGVDDIWVGTPNPCIILDDGSVVWGFQCWWGPEEVFRQKEEEYRKAGAEVRLVDLEGEPETTIIRTHDKGLYRSRPLCYLAVGLKRRQRREENGSEK